MSSEIKRVPISEVISECERNAATADFYRAVIFEDAAFYLRRMEEALFHIEVMTRFGYPGFRETVYFKVNEAAREALSMEPLPPEE